MHKHSTVILLVVLVVFLSAFIIWEHRDGKRGMNNEQQSGVDLVTGIRLEEGETNQ
jgi:hypothetical protein